jgi:hypothetical protein
MLQKVALSGLLFAVLHTACDDGEPEGEPAGSMQSTRVVSSLSEFEWMEFCVDEPGKNVRQEDVCRLVAAAAGQLGDGDYAETCRGVYAQCLQTPVTPPTGTCREVLPRVAACQLEIADLRRCFAALGEQQRIASTRVSCEQAPEPDECCEGPACTPSCAEVERACPGLLSTSSAAD